MLHVNGDYPINHVSITEYLKWQWNTNDFLEILQRLGDIYGIQPDYSGYTEEQQKRTRKRVAERELRNEIATFITSALQKDNGSVAREYLSSRHLQPSARLGAWNTTIQTALAKHLCKKFPTLTATKVAEYLAGYFPTKYADDYQLAAPYYNGDGNVLGFWLRLTSQETTYTTKNGEVVKKSKYLYSEDMPKGGYCGTLSRYEPAILVEGMLDAEAMRQAGFNNVMAVGGENPTEGSEDAANQIKTLQRFRIKKLISVPDYEYKDVKDADKNVIGKEDTPKTSAVKQTIDRVLPLLTGSAEGDGFISLHIANLETAEARTNKTKIDAADYIAAYGAAAMKGAISEAEAWYEYALRAAVMEHPDSPEDISAEAIAVYDKIENYIDRQRLKDAITKAKGGYLFALREAGVTAAALSLIDKKGADSTTAARMAEVVDALTKAKTQEGIATLLTKAQRIQNANTYADFIAQANATEAQLDALVAAKPEYLQTAWGLYRTNPVTKLMYCNRSLSFAPAAISIVAAPTNHGKTLILLQAAMDAARTTQKKILYLSFENDAEQLYARALTAYIGNVWNPNEPNPRGEVRDFIKALDAPKELFTAEGRSIDVGKYKQNYWREIAPYLSLIRTAADIDAVTNNITAYVEELRNHNTEVGGIFIDYLQLLHYPALHAHSRTDEVKAICDRLNDMAKATKIPVILAAQFNRDATKAGSDGIDGVELANIGESAGIENIAEDVYLVWQVDKINTDSKLYNHPEKTNPKAITLQPHQYRSRRCFTGVDAQGNTTADALRRGYLYVENLKARDYATGGYCLLPFNGAAGCITSQQSEI